MRAVQLARELGARVASSPTSADCRWADAIVLVKKAAAAVSQVRSYTTAPVIWDALDFWQQPAQNNLTRAGALALLRDWRHRINPSLFVGATDAMASDGAGVYLPHQARIGLAPTPARDRVHAVGYDGNELYLGRWRGWLMDACRARGWTFVINPPDLSAMDVLVALRDGPWDGWMCRQWKSGVKLVNAIVAGRPIVTQDSAAWRELQPDGSIIETREDLEVALDTWACYGRRMSVAASSERRYQALSIPALAATYRSLIASHVFAA